MANWASFHLACLLGLYFTGKDQVACAKSCIVGREEYRLGEDFSYVDKCFRFSCHCNTDGSWNCPASKTVNVCDGGSESGAGREGKAYGGGGIVGSRRTQPEADKYCNVNGEKHGRGSSFSYDQGCYRFNCMCNADGSWNCPATRTENLCEGQETAARSSRTGASSAVSRDGRRESHLNRRLEKTVSIDGVEYCDVRGAQYPLGRRFSYDHDCYRYQCMCEDDGSWNCPGETAVQYCDQMESGSRSGTISDFNSGSASGSAYGSSSKSSSGSSSSSISSGSYNRRTSYQGGTDYSQYCEVNQQTFPRGEPFTFTEGCYKFNCMCYDDGGWMCPSTGTENICQERDTSSRSRGTSSGSRDTSSRSRGTGSSSRDTESSSRTSIRRYSVRTSYTGGTDYSQYCLVNQQTFPRGEPFTFTEGCYKFNCMCYDDGGWMCPSTDTENICGESDTSSRSRDTSSRSRGTGSGSRDTESSSRTTIRRYNVRTSYTGGADYSDYCLAKGKTYPRGNPFTFTEGCYKFNCMCYDDGGWLCKSTDTEYICGDRDTSSRSRDTSSSSRDSESSNRRTIIRRYNVRTSYTGGSDYSDYCLAKGKRYPRGNPFTFTEGCYKFNCMCYDDGGWLCKSTDTEYICGDRDTSSRSRDTSSSSRDSESSNRRTIIRRYNVRTSYTGGSDYSDYCLAKGKRYPRGNPFTFTEGCYKFNCMCYDDGGWLCKSTDTEYICGDRDTSSSSRDTSSSSRDSESSRRTIIRRYNVRTSYTGGSDYSDYCLVKGKRYPRGNPFTFTEGCYKFNCMCYDDGGWLCKSTDTEYICGDRDTSSRSRDTSSSSRDSESSRRTIIRRYNVRTSYTGGADYSGYCLANRQTFPRGKPFSFTDGCYEFNCMCYDDGGWRCPSTDTKYICGEGGTSSRSRDTSSRSRDTDSGSSQSSSRTIIRRYNVRTSYTGGADNAAYCLVKGEPHLRGQPFTLEEDCYRFHCMCNADGGWICPSSDTEYICTDRDRTTGRRTESRTSNDRVGEDSYLYCLVDNIKYSRGQPFAFDQRCYRFNCMCEHDGSWNCPAEKTVNLCGGNERISRSGKTTIRRSSVVIGGGGDRRPAVPDETDDFCEVAGQSYPRGRQFSYEQDCYRYRCTCHRNGRLDCPDQDRIWICGEERKQNTGGGETTERRTKTETSSSRRTERYQTGTNSAVGADAENMCLVAGSWYARGRSFSFDQGCYRFRCQCGDDGSWNCPATDTVNLCGGREKVSRSGQTIVTRRRVESAKSFVIDGRDVGDITDICLVSGKAYPRGKGFSFDDGCYRFQCECHGDGSWECPAENTANLCGRSDRMSRSGRTIISRSTTSTGSSTQPGFCQVNNQQFNLGQPFSFTDGCYSFRCFCSRNGVWNCPAKDTLNLCGGTEKISRSGRTSVSSTRVRAVNRQTGDSGTGTASRDIRCRAGGTIHQLGQAFSFDEGCYRFRCFCNTDGSWNCPAEDTENLCGGSERVSRSGSYSYTRTSSGSSSSSSSSSSSGSSSSSSSSSIRSTDGAVGGLESAKFCLVDNTEYQLNRDFGFDQGCYRFKCFCSGDGSWSCPAARTKNLCGRADKRGRSGKTYYRRGSGSYPSGSRWCQVKGQYYRLNSRFSYQRGCTKFNCLCRGDGTFTCPGDQTEDLCGKTNEPKHCTVEGKTYRLNTRFTYEKGCLKYNCICRPNGAHECPASHTQNICEEEREERLGYCLVKGQYYRKKSSFSYTEQCYKFNCECRGDGSYICPPERTENVCNKPERVFCFVNGQYHRPKTRFSYTEDCFKYNCECKADGTHECPQQDRQRVCADPTARPPVVERAGYCHVEGQYYRWDTSFSYTKRCRRFHCRCTDKGRVDCPKERTEKLCDETTPAPERCYVEGQYHAANTRFTYTKSCQVFSCRCGTAGRHECSTPVYDERCAPTTPKPAYCSVEGKYYRTNARFSYVKDCYKYNCMCRHDGSYNCPSSGTQNVCTPAPTRRPGHCEVSGQYYRLNRRFSYRRGCTKFNCFCRSDGSFECPATDSEDLCRVTPDPRAGQCFVEGRYYLPNRRFTYDRGCTRHSCWCDSRGRHQCPESGRVDLCATPKPTAPACLPCAAKGRTIAGGQRFSYEESCLRYSCECRCDGTWTCPSQHTRNICQPKEPQCLSCTVKGRTYAGDSDFTHREGCYELSCRCRCDGTWDCVSDRARNVCPTRPPTTKDPNQGVCRYCEVRGLKYAPNTPFSYYEGCYEYNCDCDCSGRPNCPPSRTKNICGETCRDCLVRGQAYRPNTQFELHRGCSGFDCTCACNGTYSCPESTKFDVCGVTEHGCKRCHVNELEFPPNKRFKFIEACFEYDCDCECDGSWHCPESRTETICEDALPEGAVVQGTCGTCKIGLKNYKGNTRFKHIQECFEFICDCNCGGSWDCDADQTKNLCEDGIPADSARLVDIETCRECDVSGVTFSSQRPFSYRRDCVERECFCHCDGTWNCPKEKDICSGSGGKSRPVTGTGVGTRSGCLVKGVRYRTTEFSFTEGCFEYNCRCEDDGSYNCPASKTKKVC